MAYDAASGLNTILTNLWYDHAQQKEAYPYGVFHEIGNVPSPVFGGASEEVSRWQFSLFDNQASHARLLTAVAQMYLAFDDATLTLADTARYKFMSMERIGETSLRWTAENVWQKDIDYRMRIWRTAS